MSTRYTEWGDVSIVCRALVAGRICISNPCLDTGATTLYRDVVGAVGEGRGDRAQC